MDLMTTLAIVDKKVSSSGDDWWRTRSGIRTYCQRQYRCEGLPRHEIDFRVKRLVRDLERCAARYGTAIGHQDYCKDSDDETHHLNHGGRAHLLMDYYWQKYSVRIKYTEAWWVIEEAIKLYELETGESADLPF